MLETKALAAIGEGQRVEGLLVNIIGGQLLRNKLQGYTSYNLVLLKQVLAAPSCFGVQSCRDDFWQEPQSSIHKT